MKRGTLTAAVLASGVLAALLLVPNGDLGSSDRQRERAAVPAPPVDVCGMLEEVLGPDATYDPPVLDADVEPNKAVALRYPSRDVRVCEAADVEIPTPDGPVRLTTIRIGVSTMGSKEDAIGRVSTQTAQIDGMELRDIADERVRLSGFIIGKPDSWQDLQYRVVDEYSISLLFTYQDSEQPKGHAAVTELLTGMADDAELDPADWID